MTSARPLRLRAGRLGGKLAGIAELPDGQMASWPVAASLGSLGSLQSVLGDCGAAFATQTRD